MLRDRKRDKEMNKSEQTNGYISLQRCITQFISVRITLRSSKEMIFLRKRIKP